jgi:hypothetical protein
MPKSAAQPLSDQDQLRLIRKKIERLQDITESAEGVGFRGGLLWDSRPDGTIGQIYRSPQHPNSVGYTQGVESAIRSLGEFLLGKGSPRERVFETLWTYANDFLPNHVQISHTKPIQSRCIVNVLDCLHKYIDSLIPDDRQRGPRRHKPQKNLGFREGLVEWRKKTIKAFRKKHDLMVPAFARKLGMSPDTIRAIVRDDISRGFATSKRDALLKELGITDDKWSRGPKEDA